MSQGSARASLPAGTSSSAQRGVLFGQLLRGGPARSGPIYDRLGPDGVSHIVTVLSPSELALLAALVFGAERVARAGALPTATLVTLVRAATQADADRMFAALPPERASEIRRALCRPGALEERSGGPRSGRRVRPDTGVGVVLRLRRLFRL